MSVSVVHEFPFSSPTLALAHGTRCRAIQSNPANASEPGPSRDKKRKKKGFLSFSSEAYDSLSSDAAKRQEGGDERFGAWTVTAAALETKKAGEIWPETSTVQTLAASSIQDVNANANVDADANTNAYTRTCRSKREEMFTRAVCLRHAAQHKGHAQSTKTKTKSQPAAITNERTGQKGTESRAAAAQSFNSCLLAGSREI